MDAPRGMWQAVAVTLLGHGAVLGYFGTRPPAIASDGVARPFAFTVYVRPALGAPEAKEATRPALLLAPEPKEAAEPPPPKPRESAPRSSVVGAAGASAPDAASAPADEPPYLPRGELTVPPQVLGTADVRFPDDVEGIVHLNVRVTLFIDEGGSVQRIRIDTPGVHPSFERAIRETFAAARFSPGELHEVPVRSQMRLEVSFEAPERAPASAGSRPPPS